MNQPIQVVNIDFKSSSLIFLSVLLDNYFEYYYLPEPLPKPSKYHQGDSMQSPEGRNYVAYIPVPINNDDDDEEEYDDEYEDDEYYDEEEDEYDEEYYEDDEDEVDLILIILFNSICK